MKLRRVVIENFRGLRHLDIALDDTVVLIGENNSGKTAVLDALRLCLRELGPRRRLVFDPYDFHLKDGLAEPTTTDPISIELTFSEDQSGEWNDQLVARMTRLRILQVDGATGRSSVRLRVTCRFDSVTREYEQNWAFLAQDGNELPNVPEAALPTLQREVNYYYLGALRDAARHFDPKGPFWRPFLKDTQLTESKRAEIEEKLLEVNELVVQSHGSFEQARNRLRKVQEVVPMSSGDVVSIEAVPGRLFDMLSKAQVNLGGSTGAKVPVGRHGEGTQSLSVVMLFSAMLEAFPAGAAIVGLEEPEAHLHPSAIRSLWRLVEGIAGQRIVTTHSGDLLSEVPARAVRRLTRDGSGVKLRFLRAHTLSEEEERKFNFHIRASRGELLFARSWLLVEGEADATLLAALARIESLDLERAGVRCVPFQHVGLDVFLKVADDFGIQWCVLSDNDQQGIADQTKVSAQLGTRTLSDVLHVLTAPNLEEYLCGCGFGHVYLGYLGRQSLASIVCGPSDQGYWPEVVKAASNLRRFSKPGAALKVAEHIRNGNGVTPPMLKQAILAAKALAEM